MILEPAVKDWDYMVYVYVFRLDFLDSKISTSTWTQKKKLSMLDTPSLDPSSIWKNPDRL